MGKKTKRAIAIVMAVVCMFSTSITAFAASTNVNSVGSVVQDIETQGTNPATSNTDGITGYDDTQDRETEYALYADTDMTGETAASTDVYATQASTFSVVVPVVLVMDGESKDGDHAAYGQIQVKGNIAGNEYVSVEPDASFKLSQLGKDDVTAKVTQDNKYFCVADSTAQTLAADKTFVNTLTTDFADTVTNITITAPDARNAADGEAGISAGSWAGSYNTNIALNVAA